MSNASNSPTSPRPSLLFAPGSPASSSLPSHPASIKLQRVPSAVRTAQILQPATSPSEVVSTTGAPRVSPTPTPSTSRRPSAGKDGLALATLGPYSSEADSGSVAHQSVDPTTSLSASASSAYSPLFNMADIELYGRRVRARTVADTSDVFGSSSSASPAQRVTSSAADLGRSIPDYSNAASSLSRGLSPLALAGLGTRAFSLHVPQTAHESRTVGPSSQRRSSHRRSLAPLSPGASADLGGATDEYAKIIMQSRSAKMQKWKTGSPKGGTAEATRSSGEMPRPRRSTSFDEVWRRGDTSPEVDIADAGGPPTFESALHALQSNEVALYDGIEGNDGGEAMETSGMKEVEWVDWLEEYRKMKEAKMLADTADSNGGGLASAKEASIIQPRRPSAASKPVLSRASPTLF